MSQQYINDYASGSYPPRSYDNSYSDPNSQRNNSPSPYYNNSSSAAYMTSTPPAYASQQRLVESDASSHRQYQRPLAPDGYSGTTAGGATAAGTSNLSPFESVFDDHVYPVNSHQNPYSQNSKQVADTAYYGLGGHRTPSEDNMLQPHDGIPLQDRAAKSDIESPDHVYDIPQGQMRR